jgi:hypothetical protein
MPGAGGGARPPDFGPLTPLWRYRLTHSDHPSKMRPRIRGATEKNFTTISIGVEHRDNSSDFPAELSPNLGDERGQAAAA